MPGLSIWTVPLKANPSGGVIVHGNVNIGSGAGGNLQIRQNSNRAIIDWNSFSIAEGELTQFRQPGANAAVLNRVTGGDPSAIHGALRANGNVFVINPNGILVGQSGTIDVHGLVLSTLDVDNGEFLAGGDMTFRGVGEGVTNFGKINAIGGDVFLIGQTVQNSGSITAAGTVGLGAGTEVLLTANETATGERMFVRSGQGSGGTGVLNDGTIQGAAVELKAHGNVYALAINNKGSIRATGASTSGGKVFLKGVDGAVHNSGSIRASGPSGRSGRILIEAAYAKVDGTIKASGVERGGDIVVEAEEIDIGSNAVVDASGLEGGSVRIGGGVQGLDETIRNAERVTVDEGALISADGTSLEGDAGSVVLWSDGTTEFRGEVSAQAHGSGDGGFVEVSGKEVLQFDGMVSTLSAGGSNGTLLLDPTDVEINSTLTVGSSLVTASSLVAALNNGNVVISTNSVDLDAGDIFINEAVLYDEANNLSFLATRNIHANASVQNAGAGSVNLVAGWDESTGVTGTTDVSGNPNADDADMAAIVSGGAFGLDNGSGVGSVFIGDGSQIAGIAVGSLGGTTTVAANGLSVAGSATTSNSFAQLGYRPVGGDAVTGGIAVNLRAGGLTVTGGDSVDDSYAQVGHGGTGAGSAGTTVDAPISISFVDGEEGDVSLTAGSTTGRGNYAQIGHGGNNWDGAKAGAVMIDGANNVSLQGGRQDGYVQIGHGGSKDAGGSYGNGNVSGDISILNTSGAVSVAAGSGGENGYAQIGHGGIAMQGTLSGSVLVHAGTGGVNVSGGGGNRSAARIGNGGYNHDRTTSGNVTVLAQGTNAATDGITLQGGSGTAAGAGIGVGGYLVDATITGNTIVEVAAGDVSLTGGSGNRAFAHIGLGNEGNGTTTADMTGDVSVSLSDGAVSLVGGSHERAHASIGVTGYQMIGSMSGDIAVSASDGISLGNATAASYSQIGHGGANTDADLDGEIFLNVDPATSSPSGGGPVSLIGGNSSRSYAQVGHGGVDASGATSGSIVSFSTGALSLQGGTADDTYALFGHGGRNHIGNHGSSGDVIVAIAMAGVDVFGGSGLRSFAQIGSGGSSSNGAITSDVLVNFNPDTGTQLGGGDIVVRGGGGSEAHAQIGLGGALSGTLTGDTVVYGDSVEVKVGGGGSAAARIGSGGGVNRTGAMNGSTAVVATAGGISVDAIGGGGNAYAQIGSGGLGGSGTITGSDPVSTSVTATGAVEVLGGSGNNASAMIGAGGAGRDGGRTNAGVTVEGSSVEVTAGSGPSAFAMIGSGGGQTSSGNTVSSNISGDVTVTATAGDITVQSGGSNTRNFAQIGHGGLRQSGTLTGNLSVSASGAILLQSGATAESYTQIGHGGRLSSGTRSGNISVDGGGNLDLLGGSGDETYAQIGHGGTEATGDNSGSVTVTGVDAANLLAGSGARANTQIGHGGHNADGAHVGDIEVNAVESIDLVSGVGLQASSQIGHGGRSDNVGNNSGDILLTTSSATGGILMNSQGSTSNGANTASYTHIGHGGYESANAQSGDITINTAGDISLVNGARDLNYKLIGHGGRSSSASASGAINVTAAGDISLIGGTNDFSFAQVGHGGGNSSGNKSAAAVGSSGAPDGINVTSTGGAIRVLGGDQGGNANDGRFGYAQIGLGGTNSGGPFNGDVSVSAATGIEISGGGRDHNYARVGHGGDRTSAASSTRVGDILVTTATGDIIVAGAANHELNSAAIGHGGFRLGGTSTGDIEVRAEAGRVVLNSGGGDDSIQSNQTTGEFSYSSAQIGHGGSDVDLATLSGDITVVGAGGVEIDSLGDGDRAFTQIGHGGWEATGNKSGDIIVESGADLLVQGGDVEGGYALLGHGGYASEGFIDGSILVDVVGNLALNAGDSGAQNFAMIGHSLQGVVGGWGDIVERDGRIVTEGEFFDDTDSWGIAPEGGTINGGAFVGSRGGLFIQHPDGAGGGSPASGTRYATYTFTTTTGGTYRLIPRWTGYDGGSDSNYYDIVELKDGTGVNDAGVADWYEFTGSNGGFNNFAWDNSGGGYEETGAGDSNGAPVWDLAANTTYTLRVNPREDGVALDAWMLQLDGMPAPTGNGPGVTFANTSGISGASDIEVIAGGDITLNGGAGNDSHAAIGHGGSGFLGVNDNLQYGSVSDGADIRVESGGNVLLDGGDLANAAAARSYAVIGHHGIDAGFDAYGNIEVHAESGTVDLRAGDVDGASAQIGHFSGGSSLEVTRTLSGDICVVGLNGVTLTSEFADARAHSQIGHGGDGIAGDFDGDVTVVAPDGSVTLTGGASADGGNYAQVGHGGIDADGTLSGDLWVAAVNGDTTLTGGAADQSYAMIGHGDGAKTSLGDREGGVHLYSSGQLTGTNGGGTGSEVWIFHQNDNGLQPGDYLGGDGYQKVALGGINLPASATVDESTIINSNIINSSVLTIFDPSATDYVINPGDLFVDTALDYFVVTGGNISFENSYQNAGSGDITLVAGWDGSNIGSTAGGFFFENGDYCSPAFQEPSLEVDFNNCDTFGNDGKTVTIGSSGQSEPVLVGSRGGTTTVAGYGLTLNGGSSAGAATQLGFRGDGSGDITGEIQVRLKDGGLVLNAGSADGAYTQIGHGGAGGTDNIIDAEISLSFCAPGVVELNASSAIGGYAQIGHGGTNTNADISGNISMVGAGAITLDGGSGEGAYSQIGNGGLGALGTKDGDISVSGQSLEMNSGGINAYTQIGSGGLMTRGDVESAISVTSTVGGVALNAGASDNAYSLIGSGGAIADGQFDGDIIVTSAAGVDVIGGGEVGDGIVGVRNFAQIGHALQGAFIETIDGVFFIDATDFSNRDPNWIVIPGEGPTDPVGVYSGESNGNFVQLRDSAPGGGPLGGPSIEYEIEITTTGTYRLLPRWTGYDGNSDSIYWDVVELKDGTGGTIADWYEFAGRGGGDFSTVGFDNNGGFEQTGAGVVNGGPALFTFNTAGTYTVRITPREPGVAVDDFVLQLDSMPLPGPGGPQLTRVDGGIGGATGNITVNAIDDINVTAGINSDSYAAIGHGGSDRQDGNQASFGTSSNRSDISIISQNGSISLDAGQDAGDVAGTVRRYATIGHHGTGEAGFSSVGDIEVRAEGGTISLLSGVESGDGTRIGHGGTFVDGDRSGDITVSSLGDLTLSAGSGENASAQIGHGGVGGSGNVVDNDISITFGSPADVLVDGGTGTSAYAQIGHGGLNFDGDLSGDVTVGDRDAGLNNVASVTVNGGGGAGGVGTNAYAQIGLGGNNTVGVKDGNVAVTGESILIQGGEGQRTAAQIGNGGAAASRDVVGVVDVTSLVGNIDVLAGAGSFSGAQIGHGGFQYVGSIFDQAVNVTSAGDVTVQGGGLQSAGLIGNGGNSASGLEISGPITVSAVNDVNVAGGLGSVSVGQIGNIGGQNTALRGDITVSAGNDVSVIAPNPDSSAGAYAKIGNGDDFRGALAFLGSTGARSGNIEVGAGSDVSVTNAMIGHSNSDSRASSTAGVTQIGVSRNDPTDASGGNLIVDADSVISGIDTITGEDELRFYLPRRENNQIAAGAELNGVSYVPIAVDAPTQASNEFTINIIGDVVSFPNEHGNVFGTGPQPPVPDGFAFYYDTLELVDPPVVVAPGGGSNGSGGDAGNATGDGSSDLLSGFLGGLFPDDRLSDDDQREHEEEYTAWYPFSIYYEGYGQYGSKGESVFKLEKIEGLESLEGPNVPETILFDESVLESQQQNLGATDSEEIDSEMASLLTSLEQ